MPRVQIGAEARQVGALQLQESTDVLPSERLDEVSAVARAKGPGSLWLHLGREGRNGGPSLVLDPATPNPPGLLVRRGGIEPPTRGFSVRPEFADLPEKNAVPDVPRGGFGAVTDPDEAVRAAIKAAVDADRLELAARLIDVLRDAPKPGAVVRLETAKRAR